MKTFKQYLKENSVVTFLKMKDHQHGVAHVSVNSHEFDKDQDKATFATLKKDIVGIRSLHKLKVLSRSNVDVLVEVEFVK